jgi:hypothetical protein
LDAMEALHIGDTLRQRTWMLCPWLRGFPNSCWPCEANYRWAEVNCSMEKGRWKGKEQDWACLGKFPDGSYCGSQPCTQDVDAVVHCERSERSVGDHVVSVDFTVQLPKKAVTLQPTSQSCALSKSNWTPWVAWHQTRNFSLH